MFEQVDAQRNLGALDQDELARALRANLKAAVAAQASAAQASPQIDTRVTPAVTQSWSPVPFPYFNIVAQADVADGADVAAVLRPYRENGVTAVWFQLSPSPLANQLLLANGLALHDTRRCMAVTIADVPLRDTDATMCQVKTEAQCRDWVRVQSAANGGFPPVVQTAYVEMMLAGAERPLAFVAYAGRRPVACSLLLLGGGLAGIYQVATVPEARRRGYGRGVTQAALQHAARLGCTTSVLIATQMGAPVYAKMGYRDFLWAQVYLFSP